MSRCWADPLTRTERRELAAKLARACRLFHSGSRVAGRSGDAKASLAMTLTSAEMANLHTDVTRRAGVTR